MRWITATVLGGGVDDAVDGSAALDLVVLLGMELEVEAVSVFREREQAIVGEVSAQDGGDRRAGR